MSRAVTSRREFAAEALASSAAVVMATTGVVDLQLPGRRHTSLIERYADEMAELFPRRGRALDLLSRMQLRPAV